MRASEGSVLICAYTCNPFRVVRVDPGGMLTITVPASNECATGDSWRLIRYFCGIEEQCAAGGVYFRMFAPFSQLHYPWSKH